MGRSMSRRGFLSNVSIVGGAVGAAITVPAVKAHVQSFDADGWLDETLTPADRFGAAQNPDPAHLFPRGGGWLVRPADGDDHDNLEWALRHTERGGTVQLVRGTYKVGRPIVVADFDGALVGAGASRTTITCTDEFSYEIWEAPGGGRDNGRPKPPPFPRISVNGSTTRTAPSLISFYKTPVAFGENPEDRANRIEIRNIRCRGAMLGELWAFGDEVLCINIVNSLDWHNPGAAPHTTRQDVHVSGVEVDGYRSPAFGPFENGCACISVLGGVILTSNYNLEGDVDGDALGIANGGLLGVTPAEGSVAFVSCTFRNCRVGPGAVGYRSGSVLFEHVTTDGCRGNCLQVIDVADTRVTIVDNDLRCDSILLPPQLAGGATDLPSSLGCVVALQGLGASIGYPQNLQWLTLAGDQVAHARHPEAGPLGTWRPQGPTAIPERSTFRIRGNSCESSLTANTYCLHLVDLSNLAYQYPSLTGLVVDNRCEQSQTCIGLEHLDGVRVSRNECSPQQFGVELHNTPRAIVSDNAFTFPNGVACCDIRTLALGDKIDFSRVVPGAGYCMPQI